MTTYQFLTDIDPATIRRLGKIIWEGFRNNDGPGGAPSISHCDEVAEQILKEHPRLLGALNPPVRPAPKTTRRREKHVQQAMQA